MSQVLSQSEVDALLAAVSEGEIGAGEGQGGGTQVMTALSLSMTLPHKTASFAVVFRSSTLFTRSLCGHSAFRCRVRYAKLQPSLTLLPTF